MRRKGVAARLRLGHAHALDGFARQDRGEPAPLLGLGALLHQEQGTDVGPEKGADRGSGRRVPKLFRPNDDGEALVTAAAVLLRHAHAEKTCVTRLAPDVVPDPALRLEFLDSRLDLLPIERAQRVAVCLEGLAVHAGCH